MNMNTATNYQGDGPSAILTEDMKLYGRVSPGYPTMIIQKRHSGLHVNLFPGEYYAAGEPVTIRTLLGSCVAACLYDPLKKVIGMNHFLLSNRRYARNMPVVLSEAGRYGVHAMELLINDMLKLGAKRANLRAKVFGGGSIYLASESRDNFFCVGEVNVRFIREFLKNDGIPLVAEDLGGESARVIHFLFEDYSVHMKKIAKSTAPGLVLDERQLWLKDIEDHERARPQAEVWR